MAKKAAAAKSTAKKPSSKKAPIKPATPLKGKTKANAKAKAAVKKVAPKKVVRQVHSSPAVAKAPTDGIKVLRKQWAGDKKLSPVADFLVPLFEKHFPAELGLYIKRVQDLPWWHRERSLLGLFNNAVVRKDKKGNIISLQQFSSSPDSKVGRADLWVADRKKKTDYLFESKYETVTPAEGRKRAGQPLHEYLHRVLHQANTYYKAERRHYSKRTYAIALMFESIGGNKKVVRAPAATAAVHEHWGEWEIAKAKEGVHFMYLYQTGWQHREAAIDDDYPWLAVYGRIVPLPITGAEKQGIKKASGDAQTPAVNTDVGPAS